MQNNKYLSLPDNSKERDVVILLSDMINYSGRTGEMSLTQIRDFMYAYHIKIRNIIRGDKETQCTFEPNAGDGTVAIYDCATMQEKKENTEKAIATAIRLSKAMVAGQIPPTRIGLFSGKMIQATLDNQILRFTPAFAAARRLENLCNYFQCCFLMGKEPASLADSYRTNIVKIGKITPRNFTRPIEIFTIYKPGILYCPTTVDQEKLQEFITIKNSAVDLFHGDSQQGIKPDFQQAKEKLLEANALFTQLCGKADTATGRLLEYIAQNPCPSDNFIEKGIRIRQQRSFFSDIQDSKEPDF